MTAKIATREVTQWVRTSSFVRGELTINKTCGEYRISFQARTTKTRASSILTRMSHVVGEICVGKQWYAEKACLGKEPLSNDQLGDWEFSITILISKPWRLQRITDVGVHEPVRV